MTFQIHYKDSVDSTMDLAREHITNNNDTNYVVFQSGEQTGGRGRRGNLWVSPYGNLYQSIILKPNTNRQHWGQLSFVMAVALAKSCFEIGMPKSDIQLKWPNDVLVNDQKLAGILIEVMDNHVIIGTGVNVQHAPADRAKTSDFSDTSIDDFRDIFLNNIANYYNEWELNGFVPIHTQWMTHAYKLNETIQARVNNNIYEGVFENLDDDGTLLLRTQTGTIQKINAGEIIACS